MTWSPIFFVMAVLSMFLFTYWIYRYTIPPVSGLYRLILIILRIGSLLLGLSAIFGTVLIWTTQYVKKPTVGVLIDTSQSMNIVEDKITRGQDLQKLIRSPALKKLEDSASLRIYCFSDNVITLESIPDSIAFNGSATDMAQPLKMINDLTDATGLTALFLLSDGRHNAGENPVSVGEELKFPVYTITMGTQQERKDLQITQVRSNEVTYVGNRIPVEVFIKGPGFAGEPITVRLRKEENIIDERSLIVPSDGFEISQFLYFTPQNPGFQKYAVDITRLENEFTDENNHREFYVRVIKNKLNVLVLAGSPSPDLAFLKRILLNDTDLLPIFRTWKSEANFYEGSFPPENEIQSTDVIILLDFPHLSTPVSAWINMKDILQQSQKPFLLMAGKNVDFQKWNELESIIPIYLPQKVTERRVLPQPTMRGRIHPVLRIKDNQNDNLQVWTQLPPIYSCWSNFVGKGGSELLMTGIPESAIGSSSNEEIPMLFAQSIGEKKSLLFLGYSFYRWDLIMWNMGGSNEGLAGFISNAMRWLVTEEDEKRIQLSTNKQIFHAGEEITLSAQIYDETFYPVERAIVEIHVQAPSNQQRFQLNDIGGGRYRETFRVFESGVYTIAGEALLEGQILGRDQLEFSISSYNPEFEITTANPNLMENLSRVTGGKSGPPDSLASFIQSIQLTPQIVHSTKEIELYNLPITLILMILLLSSEWLIRKRKGML
ncbi:VWA domain-containing protein [bacterium]|nr:VWA domain-containing protein [bacterium]